MGFNPQKDLPISVYDMFKLGGAMWPALVKTAVALNHPDRRYRDANWLASVVYYLHHPERRQSDGSYLPIQDGQMADIAEWEGWKKLIKPMVPSLAATAMIDSTEKPVVYLFHNTLRPMHLQNNRAKPGTQILNAAFQVRLKLDPNLPDPGRYEYRQLIRGEGSTQEGNGTANNWKSTGSERKLDMNMWKIPGPLFHGHWSGGVRSGGGVGLHPTKWKEDGLIDKTGTTRLYGHRDLDDWRPTKSSPHDEYDVYAPERLEGTDYFLTDMPGVVLKRVDVGDRIKLRMEFMGQVVQFDKSLVKASATISPVLGLTMIDRHIVHTVHTIRWAYHFDAVVTGVTPFVGYQHMSI
jgi:hypothetical protein